MTAHDDARRSLLGVTLRRSDPVVLVALVAVALLWWRPQVFGDAPLVDEVAYFSAAERIAAGASPYDDPAYLYPPLLASTLAALEPRLGAELLRTGLRVANLVLGCLGVWLGLRVLPVGTVPLLVVAVLYLAFAPPFTSAIERGNLSASVVGLTLLGLALPPRGAILGGLLLGLGLVIKPLAVLLPEPLLLEGTDLRRRPELDRRRRAAARTTAIAALASAAVLALVGLRFLPALASQVPGLPDAARMTSLHRLLWNLGLPIPSALLLLLCAAAVLATWWRLPPRRRQDALLPLGLGGSLLALPVVWPHSYLLALPLQALALRRLWRRRRAAGTGLGEGAIALAVLALLGSDALGIVEEPRALNLALTALPPLSLVALVAYLVATGEESAPGDEGSPP